MLKSINAQRRCTRGIPIEEMGTDAHITFSRSVTLWDPNSLVLLCFVSTSVFIAIAGSVLSFCEGGCLIQLVWAEVR